MAIHPSITTNNQFAIEADQSSLWQDTAATTAASATDPLGNIDDQSSNDYDALQATTAFKPTVQSGYIAFDGVNDGLYQTNIGAYANSGASFSYWIVLDDTYVNNDIVFLFSDNTTSNRIQLYHRDDGATQRYRLWVQSSSGSSFTYSTNAFSSGIKVINLIHDGSNYYVYINNTLEITASALATDPTITRLDIGSNAAVFGANAQFDLYASYLYDTAHSSGDRTTIYGDLNSAYISTVQNLAPDTVALGLTVNNATIANQSAQGLSPDTTAINFTVNDATIGNESPQSLSPDTVALGLTVNNATIANIAPQNLSPDTVSLGLTVNDVTSISNESAQGLSPDMVSIGFTVNGITSIENVALSQLLPDTVLINFTVNNVDIANDTPQGLSPDTVSIGFTVNDATIENLGQELQPDTVPINFTVNNPTIANDTPQGLSPDTVSISFTPNNVTIANDSAQSLSPDTVLLGLTVNGVTISNAGAFAGVVIYGGDLSIRSPYDGQLSIREVYGGEIVIRDA